MIEAPKTKRLRVTTNVSTKETEEFIMGFCESGKAFTSTDISQAFVSKFGERLSGSTDRTIKYKVYGSIKSLQDKGLLQRVGRIEGTPSYLYRSASRNRNQQLTASM